MSTMSLRAICSWLPRAKHGAVAPWTAVCVRPVAAARFTTNATAIDNADKGNGPLDSGNDGRRETDFGYRRVAEEEKAQLVGEVFHNVAESYDLMNDLMSAGIHRLWKNHFVQKLGPYAGSKILDVAGGTGDIAFREIDHMAKRTGRPGSKDGAVVVCDINTSMLEVGKQRATKLGYGPDQIQWVHGDAEKLPFDDNAFDAYTIAFGIRNTTHIDRVVSEAYRVLRPGGRFMCLEFSRVPYPIVSDLYDAFSFYVIPFIGEVVANDRPAYQYLVESIRKFPDQEVFLSMIQSAGFKSASYENLTGGVAAIHSGFKL